MLTGQILHITPFLQIENRWHRHNVWLNDDGMSFFIFLRLKIVKFSWPCLQNMASVFQKCISGSHTPRERDRGHDLCVSSVAAKAPDNHCAAQVFWGFLFTGSIFNSSGIFLIDGCWDVLLILLWLLHESNLLYFQPPELHKQHNKFKFSMQIGLCLPKQKQRSISWMLFQLKRRGALGKWWGLMQRHWTSQKSGLHVCSYLMWIFLHRTVFPRCIFLSIKS